jgi:hypothetical protein
MISTQLSGCVWFATGTGEKALFESEVTLTGETSDYSGYTSLRYRAPLELHRIDDLFHVGFSLALA